MIKWDGIEESIKQSDNPYLLLTYIFIHKSMITDENLSLLIRYMMKYHFNLFFKKDMRKILYLLKDYNLSQNIINDFYKNLIKQKELIDKIKKFKHAYNRYFFWQKSIKEQIEYLVNLKEKFNSYNDCCIGNLHFHKKLKLIEQSDTYSQKINEREIFNRLNLIYKLFGCKFFLTYEISLLSYEDFFYSKYIVKCNYIEYIFNIVNKILEDLIDTFRLFDCIKEQMNQLISPIPIVIEMDIFTSEIDDIDF
tara:strand:+ start:218 stop:970 length:753 start_codon:yes stop_codon:yes gene_type:complete